MKMFKILFSNISRVFKWNHLGIIDDFKKILIRFFIKKNFHKELKYRNSFTMKVKIYI